MAGRRPLADVWSVACPKCGVPVGKPCRDLRFPTRTGWGRNLYGRRTHPERTRARKEPRPVRYKAGGVVTRQSYTTATIDEWAPITWPWTVSSTTTLTIPVYNQDRIWGSWTSGTTSAAATWTTREITWTEWNRVHNRMLRTAEEEARLADARQRAREEQTRRHLAEMQRLEGAQERAMVLLDSIVPESERPLEHLIEVRGSDGHTYRIEMHRRTVHGNIVRVDEHGCVLGRACVAPRMYEGNLALPTADGWVGQYLGLKFDAAEFLSHANWSDTYRGCRRPEVPLLASVA